MSPYDLERAIDSADKSVSESKFAAHTVTVETFLLIRRLVQHMADVEGERRLALSSNTRGTDQ